MTGHGHDPYEELARRAGLDVRRAAPDDGLSRLRRSRRRRQIATGVVAAITVLGIGTAAALVATQGDNRSSAVIDEPMSGPSTSSQAPVTVPPTSRPPSTAATTATSVEVATTTAPTTTAPTTTAPTTTAPTSTAPVSVGPQTSTTTVPASPGVAPSQAPTDQLAVSYAGSGSGVLAVGWWDGTAWVDHSAGGSAPEPTIDSVAAVGVGLDDQVVTGLTLGPRVSTCAAPEIEGRTLDLGRAVTDDLEHRGPLVLATTATWPLQPRPMRRAGIDSPAYQQVGESLVEHRPSVEPTKGSVTHVVRSDLDGDGIEEVIFGFEHLTDTTGAGALGEFSLIIARLPRADGTVDDQVLFAHYAGDPADFPSPGRAGLLAIADLNGDAVMEVVVRVAYWESSAAIAYAMQSGRLVQVMSGGGCPG